MSCSNIINKYLEGGSLYSAKSRIILFILTNNNIIVKVYLDFGNIIRYRCGKIC